MSSNSPRVDLFPSMWVPAALDALASAAQLRRLHLVILPHYRTKHNRYVFSHRDSMCEEDEDYTLFRIVDCDIWEDL